MVTVSRPPSILYPIPKPWPIFQILQKRSHIIRIFNPEKYNTQALTFRDFGPLELTGRFDHHRPDGNSQPRKDSERSIYYGALALSSCLVEVFGDTRVIEIDKRRVAYPIVTSPIKLLDLRGSGAMRAGSVAALSMIVDRKLSQEWSRYFYEQTDIYSSIDGLLYSNAHNGEDAIALYERAENKLECPEENIIDLKDPNLKDSLEDIAIKNNMTFDKIT